MDFWNRMLSGIADTVLPKDIDDDTLFLQMEKALQEEKNLWLSQKDFIEPGIVRNFHEKWYPAYCSARKRTGGLLFSLGLSGRKIRNLAPQFIETYEQLPAKMQTFNEKLANQKATDAAKLILPIKGKMLDHQQLRCITKEIRNHLVLAGAGTGKTTTIIGYVKYLLKKSICQPEDILVLSFTNASAAEMSERLNKEIQKPIAAQTFHKLGLDIITAVQGKKPKIYSADIRQFVRKQLDLLIQNTAYLKKLCMYLTYNGSAQKSEFDFQTEKAYQDYLKYNPPVTLKKEKVKSYGELDIANFLTQNGILYAYEQEYPVDTRTSDYGQYHPDFYLPDFDLYIEYFGINRQGEVPSYFSGKNGMTATQTYQSSMKWKRELHRKNGTRMIEVYAYEKLEEQLLPELEEKLKKAGVIFSPLPPKALWSEISGTENQKLDRVAELFGTVITLTKSNDCSLDEIRSRNRDLQGLPSIDAIIDLIEPVYKNYQAMLHSNNAVDFNDMINLASAYIQEGNFTHAYRYVIIDEYQDISQARYRLLEAMRQQKDYRLFCVGDDWQSIYRFSGSDIGLHSEFREILGCFRDQPYRNDLSFPQKLNFCQQQLHHEKSGTATKTAAQCPDRPGIFYGKNHWIQRNLCG